MEKILTHHIMKKTLVIIILIVSGIYSFQWYTQSGEILNEATPEILPTNTQEKIESMMENAEKMTDSEKMEMEKEMVMLMNPDTNMETPPKTMSKEEVENMIMTQEEMTEKGVSRQGVFTEIDFIHKGSGKAIIFPETSNGPQLRLEDFSVTRGPDLYVYLSKNKDIQSSNELGEYHNLGLLKSSKGNQNYALPENHEQYQSVVIWCQAFGVLFSSATLQ